MTHQEEFKKIAKRCEHLSIALERNTADFLNL